MPNKTRPLSPHLQVYRPQLTSVLSILHRATGLLLAMLLLLLLYWVVALAHGPSSYRIVENFIESWAGILLIIGATFALFYHLCNGIRHLFWDSGFGFKLESVYRSGWLVLISSVLLTGLTLFLLFTRGGW